MNKRCPYHEDSRSTFTTTLFVKYAKVVAEVCDCGYVISKQRIPIKLNPDNFIKKGSDGTE